jgi:hypothetical protein
MPDLSPFGVKDLHVVLRTLALLTALAVAFYVFQQARIPEDQRPSPAVRMWMMGSAITMLVIAVGIAAASFASH